MRCGRRIGTAGVCSRGSPTANRTVAWGNAPGTRCAPRILAEGHVQIVRLEYGLRPNNWLPSSWGVALVVLHICRLHFRWAGPSGSDNWPATFGTVSIISSITFFCSPPGLSRGKRRLSHYSTGDSRYSPRDKPGGEYRNCVGDR